MTILELENRYANWPRYKPSERLSIALVKLKEIDYAAAGEVERMMEDRRVTDISADFWMQRHRLTI